MEENDYRSREDWYDGGDDYSSDSIDDPTYDPEEDEEEEMHEHDWEEEEPDEANEAEEEESQDEGVQLPVEQPQPQQPQLETVTWSHFSNWVERLPQRHLDLAVWPAKFITSLQPEGTPSTGTCDVDGLCLVGYPSTPLSFMKDPIPNDEDVYVCASPAGAAKFTAGRHLLRLGTSGAKYGTGEACEGLRLFPHGKVFHCFARWMSWPLYFSFDRHEEINEYWKDVIIPSMAVALPYKTFVAERWPKEDKFKLNAKEFALFVEEMRRLSSGEDGNFRWTHVQTVCFRVGQKLEPFDADPASFYRETLGKVMANFRIEGVDFMFWSTGCNIGLSHDDPSRVVRVGLASFWTKSFLKGQLRGARRRTNLYPLMGTEELVSAQSRGAPPEGFAMAEGELRALAQEHGVSFESETWQFYSTFIYLFKDEEGDNYPCNPYSSKWRSKSSSVDWLKEALGRREVRPRREPVDPLKELMQTLEGMRPRDDSPLRVEPTFFLRFAHDSTPEQRLEALESLANASALRLCTVYTGFCTDPNAGAQKTTAVWRCLQWLRARCTVFRAVVEDIKQEAKEKGYITPQQCEVVDYLEFAPYYWLTGKTWCIGPKVHAALEMDRSMRKYQAPVLPEMLIRLGVSTLHSDLMRSKPRARMIMEDDGDKWLPANSSLEKLPQVWFLARELPWARKMKNELALLFEFWVKLSTADVVTEDALVDDFLTIFGYCCLVRSKVKVFAMIQERRAEEGQTLSKTMSLAEVRTILSLRQGPLYAEDLAEQAAPKTLSLFDLFNHLFNNRKVLDNDYKKNISDVWVAALRFLDLATDRKKGFLKKKVRHFGPSSNLVTAVSRRWAHVLGFCKFWHCTEKKFAKTELGLFKTVLVRPDYVPRGTSEVDVATYEKERLMELKEFVRATIVAKVGEKAPDPFQEDALMLKALEASALAAHRFSRSRRNPGRNKRGKQFALLCFVRVVTFLQQGTKKVCISKDLLKGIINAYWDKSPVHTVSCPELAECVPQLFYMRGKKLYAHEHSDLQDATNKLASRYRQKVARDDID